jgi:hypothetical protein
MIVRLNPVTAILECDDLSSDGRLTAKLFPVSASLGNI